MSPLSLLHISRLANLLNRVFIWVKRNCARLLDMDDCLISVLSPAGVSKDLVARKHSAKGTSPGTNRVLVLFSRTLQIFNCSKKSVIICLSIAILSRSCFVPLPTIFFQLHQAFLLLYWACLELISFYCPTLIYTVHLINMQPIKILQTKTLALTLNSIWYSKFIFFLEKCMSADKSFPLDQMPFPADISILYMGTIHRFLTAWVHFQMVCNHHSF